jgi:hypothetical protein
MNEPSAETPTPPHLDSALDCALGPLATGFGMLLGAFLTRWPVFGVIGVMMIVPSIAMNLYGFGCLAAFFWSNRKDWGALTRWRMSALSAFALLVANYPAAMFCVVVGGKLFPFVD